MVYLIFLFIFFFPSETISFNLKIFYTIAVSDQNGQFNTNILNKNK